MVSLRTLIVGVLYIAAPVIAALTPCQIPTRLEDMTSISLSLNDDAQSLDPVTAALIVLQTGPVLVCPYSCLF